MCACVYAIPDQWSPGLAAKELRSIKLTIDPAITGLLWSALSCPTPTQPLPQAFVEHDLEVNALFLQYTCLEGREYYSYVAVFPCFHFCTALPTWMVGRRNSKTSNCGMFYLLCFCQSPHFHWFSVSGPMVSKGTSSPPPLSPLFFWRVDLCTFADRVAGFVRAHPARLWMVYC